DRVDHVGRGDRAEQPATGTGAGGRLFGSVTASDVVDAVTRAGGPQLDRRRLQLAGGIKSLGRHQVPVVLHPEVTANVALEVVEA
ncbi:MAG TPA: 50S ribosomal L9 C-terminal domain-containing protein, partial [Mycobacteriales bacterium]